MKTGERVRAGPEQTKKESLLFHNNNNNINLTRSCMDNANLKWSSWNIGQFIIRAWFEMTFSKKGNASMMNKCLCTNSRPIFGREKLNRCYVRIYSTTIFSQVGLPPLLTKANFIIKLRAELEPLDENQLFSWNRIQCSQYVQKKLSLIHEKTRQY